MEDYFVALFCDGHKGYAGRGVLFGWILLRTDLAPTDKGRWRARERPWRDGFDAPPGLGAIHASTAVGAKQRRPWLFRSTATCAPRRCWDFVDLTSSARPWQQARRITTGASS